MSKGCDHTSDLRVLSELREQPPQGLEEDDGNQPNDKMEEYSSCRTPTSLDHRIPTIQSCPATPRKKQGRVFLHKRKLTFLDFFENTRREEIESFFQSCFESPTSPRVKKRCTSIWNLSCYSHLLCVKFSLYSIVIVSSWFSCISMFYLQFIVLCIYNYISMINKSCCWLLGLHHGIYND